MKINCPVHNDNTPSMEIYETHGHCFSCGAHVSLEELGLAKEEHPKKKEKENVEETLAYISRLPKLEQRGLALHSDAQGYYIVWPGKDYFKYRRYSVLDGGVRYMGPRGHKAPLFWIKSEQKVDSVIIIEGELNALSLKAAYPNAAFDIVSPGSATELGRHIESYLNYTNIVVFVDDDSAGIANGLVLKDELIKRGKTVVLVTLEKDFNDILQSEGVEGIKRFLEGVDHE